MGLKWEWEGDKGEETWEAQDELPHFVESVYEFAFTELPDLESLQKMPNVKAMKGYPNRYRIRIGDYRVGVEISGHMLEIIRVLHRREFYRYFP